MPTSEHAQAAQAEGTRPRRRVERAEKKFVPSLAAIKVCNSQLVRSPSRIVPSLVAFHGDGRVHRRRRRRRVALPLRALRMRPAELIEYAEDEMIHQFFDVLRAMIEARTGGQDARPRARN